MYVIIPFNTVLNIYSVPSPVLSVKYALIHLIILFHKVDTITTSTILRSRTVKGVKVSAGEVRFCGSNPRSPKSQFISYL